MGIEIRATVNTTDALFNLNQAEKRIKKNIGGSLQAAAKKLFFEARNSVQRNNGKNIKNKKAKLFTPKGKPIKNKALTITQFTAGKQITKGRLKGKPVRAVKDNVEYKWTPKQGRKTRTYKNSVPGFDHWLSHQIRTTVEGNTVYLYANPVSKGKALNFLPTATWEKGGTINWKRKIPIGYIIETITHAKTKAGGKRKAHKIRYKSPRVAIRKYYARLNRTSRIAPRPFLSPTLQKFMARDFQIIFKDLTK